MADDIKKAVNIVFKVVNHASGEVKKIVDSFERLESSSKKSQDGIKKTDADLKKVGQTSSKTSTELNKSEASVKKIGGAFSQLGKSIKQSIAGFSNAASEIKKKTESIDKVANKLLTTGAKLTAAGGGILATIAFPVNEAKNFEAALSEVEAITGSTKGQMDEMSVVARELGSSTKFSATEAAGGMKLLGMAGLETKEIVTAIGPVLNLAAAAGLSLAEAADIATNVMSGMGLEVSDLNHVMDVLASTATKSNSTVGELGIAMSYAAPTAKAAGVSIDELAGAMGVLHNSGIKATRAGTALRSVMGTLASPTKAAQEVFDQLGVEIKKTDDGSIDLIGTFERLEQAGIGLAEANKAFGKQYGSVSLILAKGTGEIDKLTEANKNAEGSAKKMAKIMQDNLKGAITELSSATEGLKIALGTPLLGAFKAVVKAITSIVQKITQWAEGNTGIVKALLVTVAAIGAVATALGVLSLSIGSVAFLLPTMANGLSLVVAGFTGLLTVIKASAIAMAAWVATPIGAVLTAAAVAVGVLYVALRKLDGTSDLNQLRENLEKTKADIDTVKASTDALKKAYDNAKEGTEDYSRKGRDLREALLGVADSESVMSIEARNAADSISKTTGKIIDGGKALDDYQTKLDAITFNQALGELKQVDKEIKQLNKTTLDDLYQDELAHQANVISSLGIFKDKANRILKEISDERDQKTNEKVAKLQAAAAKIIQTFIDLGKVDPSLGIKDFLQYVDSVLPGISENMRNTLGTMWGDIQVRERQVIESMVNDYENSDKKKVASTQATTTQLNSEYQKNLQDYKNIRSQIEISSAESNIKLIEDQARAGDAMRTSLESLLASIKTQYAEHEKIARDSAKSRIDTIIEQEKAGVITSQQAATKKAKIENQLGATIVGIRKSLADKLLEIQKNIADGDLQSQKTIISAHQASLNRIAAAERDNVQKRKALNNELIEAGKSALETIEKDTEDHLKKLADKQKKYVQDLAKLNDEILNDADSLEKDLLEIKRRGFTELEKEQSKEKEGYDLIEKSRKALADGDAERAVDYAKSAASVLKGLKDEDSAISGVKDAYSALKDAQENRVANIKEEMAGAAGEAKILKENLELARTAMVEMIAEMSKVVKINIDDTDSQKIDDVKVKGQELSDQLSSPNIVNIDTTQYNENIETSKQKTIELNQEIEKEKKFNVSTVESEEKINSLKSSGKETGDLFEKGYEFKVGVNAARDGLATIEGRLSELDTLINEKERTVTIHAGQSIDAIKLLAERVIEFEQKIGEPFSIDLQVDESNVVQAADTVKAFKSEYNRLQEQKTLNIDVEVSGKQDVEDVKTTIDEIPDEIQKNINVGVTASASPEGDFTTTMARVQETLDKATEDKDVSVNYSVTGLDSVENAKKVVESIPENKSVSVDMSSNSNEVSNSLKKLEDDIDAVGEKSRKSKKLNIDTEEANQKLDKTKEKVKSINKQFHEVIKIDVDTTPFDGAMDYVKKQFENNMAQQLAQYGKIMAGIDKNPMFAVFTGKVRQIWRNRFLQMEKDYERTLTNMQFASKGRLTKAEFNVDFTGTGSTKKALGAKLFEMGSKLQELQGTAARNTSMNVDMTKFSSGLDSTQAKINNLSKGFGLNMDISKVKTAISAVKNQIESLSGITITVGSKYVQSMKEGGSVGGFRKLASSIVPGVGKGDKIPALLEPKEYIMDGVTTSFFGNDFLKNMQNIARQGIPRFSEGGAVGGKSSSVFGVKDMGTINIQLGNKGFPLSGTSNVISELKRTLERETLLRSN